MSRKRTSPSSENWPRSIVQYIAEHPDRPLKARALSRELGIAEVDYANFRALTRQMAAEGRLIHGPGRTLALPAGDSREQGVFHDAGRGYGFVIVPGRSTDLYVPRGRTKGAREGDVVIARIIKRRSPDNVHAEIERIVERAIVKWVGILDRIGKRPTIQPIGRTKITGVVTVADPTACDAQAGRHGGRCGRLTIRRGHSRIPQGEIVENLGDPKPDPH